MPLDALIRPRSIAIVGASEKPTIGRRLVARSALFAAVIFLSYSAAADQRDTPQDPAATIIDCTESINSGKWKGRYLAAYYTNRAAAYQICEANFYSGELSLTKGSKDEASRLFRLASKDCPQNFDEWDAANAELKALGVVP